MKIEIATVDRTTLIDRPAVIDMPLNERATMRFTCLTGLLPAKRAEVIAYLQDDTTKLFTGVIIQRRMRGYVERALPAYTDCEAADFSVYADWCFQTKTYSTGPTLKTVLTDLVNDKLDEYGIALHASQVDGPTLAPFSWTDKRVSDCLRELSDRAPGYVYRIDADKKLRMFVIGTDSAPFTVTTGTPNVEDLSWEDSVEAPANTVIVRCGPSGTGTATQEWTANGVATSWVTDIPAAVGFIPSTVTVGGVVKTVGTGAQYEWDDTTSTLSVGTDSTPADTTSIVLVYTAQFPFTVTATTGATPPIEAVYNYPDVVEYAPAVELADGLLDQLDQEPRTLRMPTLEHGCYPGQALTVTHTSRDFSGAATTITHVTAELLSDDFWRYHLTAQETDTAVQRSTLAKWRALTGGSSSGAITVAGSGGGGGSTTVNYMAPFALGGSDHVSIDQTTAGYQPVVNYMSFPCQATTTAQVKVYFWTRTATGNMRARLYDVTAAASAGDTGLVTAATSRTSGAMVVVLTEDHEYRLEVQSDTNGNDVYCVGVLYPIVL